MNYKPFQGFVVYCTDLKKARVDLIELSKSLGIRLAEKIIWREDTTLFTISLIWNVCNTLDEDKIKLASSKGLEIFDDDHFAILLNNPDRFKFNYLREFAAPEVAYESRKQSPIFLPGFSTDLPREFFTAIYRQLYRILPYFSELEQKEIKIQRDYYFEGAFAFDVGDQLFDKGTNSPIWGDRLKKCTWSVQILSAETGLPDSKIFCQISKPNEDKTALTPIRKIHTTQLNLLKLVKTGILKEFIME